MDNAYSPYSKTATSRKFTASYWKDINAMVTSAFEKSGETSAKLYYDTSIAHMAINALTDYVIGPGLVPTANPERSIVGWTNEQRKKFSEQAEAYWRLTTNSLDFDHYGKNSFRALQKIAFKNILIKGDVLLHTYYRDEKNSYMPCVQILSGQWVTNPNQAMDTKEVTAGVRLNKEELEIGYYIAKTDEERLDSFECTYVSKYNKAGQKEFDLIKLGATEANQIRGIPILSAVRDDILHLEVAKTNYITKFIVEAILTAVVTTDKDQTVASSRTLDTLKSLGGQSKDASRTPTDVNLSAGNVVVLQPGEDMKTIQSSQSSQDYSQLEKTVLSCIGGAIGVPYEMLLKQYGSSYSASKATISSASKTFDDLRREFAEKFCNVVYKMVIDYGIRAGNIDAPGYLEGNDLYQRAVLSVNWIGPTPVIMEPIKEANAQKVMIENNFTTMEKACRDLTGLDYEEIIERRVQEIELFNQMMTKVVPPNDQSNNQEDSKNE